jgi:hypothetical protein
MGTYTHQHTATYQTDILDNREHAEVTFATTVTDTHTAYGVLLKGNEDNPNTVEDFEKLVGQTALFRDLAGGVQDVAITEVIVNHYTLYDEITVSMTEIN